MFILLLKALAPFTNRLMETMLSEYKKIIEETYGDSIFEINTNLIEKQFDLIVNKIKDKINKYMEL